MGQPTVDHGRALRRRRAARCRRRPPANGPCVTAQWITAATARHVERTAAAAARQPGDLRADRHAAASIVVTQTRVTGMLRRRMNIDFPFHFDGRGRTAATDDDDHIRDMIEQLLFTSPGERVNRPDFGSGLLQMVFAPNSPELAAALQFTTQAALQRYSAT